MIVREVHSAKVAVVGAVQTPGRYEMQEPGDGARDDRAARRGSPSSPTATASSCCARTAARTTRIPFNYRKVAERPEQDNFFVEPGDIIVVP